MSENPSKNIEEQESTGENVDKIREILFGKNMRAFEERFNLLEQNYQADIANLQKTFEQHLQNLESLLHDKIKSLQGRAQEIDGALNDSINKFDNKVSDLETVMQSEMHSQKQDMLNHVADVRKSLREQLDNNREVLQESKMDKQEISALFAELALKAGGNLDEQS